MPLYLLIYNRYNAGEFFSCIINLGEEGQYLDKALIDEILKDIGLEHIDEDDSDSQA